MDFSVEDWPWESLRSLSFKPVSLSIAQRLVDWCFLMEYSRTHLLHVSSLLVSIRWASPSLLPPTLHFIQRFGEEGGGQWHERRWLS